MEQHAIPRQITTFEFKLIGFLTLKQFLYIVIFILSGVIVFFLVPIPILNIVSAGFVGFIGIAFAFIQINDRPLDVWVKNFLKKLNSPTQFYYHKNNPPPDFLKDVYIKTAQNQIASHVDARKKLAAYLNAQKPQISIKKGVAPSDLKNVSTLQKNMPKDQKKPSEKFVEKTQIKQNQPFLVGYIKNTKKIPLPGILIYIKNSSGKIERILKTNSHGVFATFHSLPEGTYLFETKDVSGKYFFDTMNVQIYSENPNPIIINSKESL